MSLLPLANISFEILFDNAQMASIIIMDENGVILNCNKGVLKSYGYEPNDLKGKYFSILFTPEDRMKNMPEIELSRAHQKHASSDRNYIVHKDGSYIWSHGETVFTRDKEGKIRLIKLIYDINSQKLQEKYLVKANEDLKQFNQELDSFVYSASHDLKAPIANIEALLRTLEEEMNEESRKNAEEILNMLKISVEKFKSTIADLTTTGRQLAGKKGEVIHFIEVIELIKTDLHEEIEKSKAVFIEDFGQATVIKMSKKDLRSILYNLLSNAIKYRSPDRKPEVRLKTSQSNSSVIIEVADNGLGIKKEDLPRIFDMYTRLHTHVEGTGVGMSIIKKIVDSYGGKIEVDSKEGEGTSFKIFVPN